MAGAITDVNDTNFQAEVLESGNPVLVDFWAPWCGPCRVIAPHLEELNEEQANLRVVKLNVDDNQQTAARYEVLSIPTLILFKNGAGGEAGHRRAAEEAARAGDRRRSFRRLRVRLNTRIVVGEAPRRIETAS